MIVVLLLLIAVVVWALFFIDKLIDNMKDTRAQIAKLDSASLSACSCVISSSCASNNAIHKAELLLTGVTNATVECGAMIQNPAPYITEQMGEKFRKNNEHDDSMSICNAYEALDREFTSWLTVLGLFAGIFSLVIPLVSYLLQHKTLKDERELINKYVDDLKSEQRDKHRDIDDKISSIRQIHDEFKRFRAKANEDLQSMKMEMCDTKKQAEDFLSQNMVQLTMWKRQIVAFAEYSIAEKYNRLQKYHTVKDSVDMRLMDVANLIIAFDYLLECFINWREEDEIKVKAKMLEWINYMKAFWLELPEIERKRVCKILKPQFNPSSELAKRHDFLRLLRADSDEFKWLEEFYKPFAPWKFS